MGVEEFVGEKTDIPIGSLRVWHIPQIPMKAFYVPVESPEEAIKIINILVDYDCFQFDNNVKPDYSSVQGLQVVEEYNDYKGNKFNIWTEWYNEDGDDIDDYEDSLAE